MGDSISPSDLTNVNSTFRTTSVLGITANTITIGFSQLLGSGLNPYPVNSVTLTVSDFDGAITAGETYSAVVGAPDPLNPFSQNYATLRVTVSTGAGAAQAYAAQGGTVRVSAFNGDAVTIQVENVSLAGIGGVGSAPGSFVLNGTFTTPLTRR